MQPIDKHRCADGYVVLHFRNEVSLENDPLLCWWGCPFVAVNGPCANCSMSLSQENKCR